MNINTLKLLLAASLFLILGACATLPPDLSAMPDERYAVPVEKVIVSNYAQAQRPRTSDGAWSNEFFPLPNESTSPAFIDLVAQRLAAQFHGGGRSGSMEIALLRANILIKARVADSVPIVGIFSALAERPHMCAVEVNFRHADLSVRRQFEVVDILPLTWTDAEPADKAALVERCLADIFGQIHSFAVDFAKPL